MKILWFLLVVLAVSATSAAPLKIGAVFCDAGSQRALDEPSWQGAQAAVALQNQAGGIRGRKVELIRIPADSSTAAVSAGVRSALTAHPDMAAFIGLSDTDLALAAGREARQAGKVFVTSGATSPLLPDEVGEGFFLVCFGDDVQAAAAADWLRAQGAKKVGILFDDSKTYTRLLSRYFAKAFTASGGVVNEQIAFLGGEEVGLPADLKSCDAIFLSAESATDAQTVIAKLRAAGFAGPVVGGDGYDNPAAWSGNQLAKNVFYTTHAFPAQGQGAAGEALLAAFHANYRGGEVDAFSGLGFDAARVVMDGLARGGDLAEEIQRRTKVEGLTGAIHYDEGRRVPTKPVAIIDAESPFEVLSQETVVP
jgi:branched-chain amino acid transport system substrate-binding protein